MTSSHCLAVLYQPVHTKSVHFSNPTHYLRTVKLLRKGVKDQKDDLLIVRWNGGSRGVREQWDKR
jgi:hypothetical protein